MSKKAHKAIPALDEAQPADHVVPLTGSSPSTGEPPTFEPIAPTLAPHAYHTIDRPVLRSSSYRLAELVAEHRRLVDFYDAISSAEDNHEFRVKKLETGHATGTDHAIRMLKECEGLIEAIPARSLHDLGLKARVLSWSRADWWDKRENDEPGARNLVDDVLSLTGVDRIRRDDIEFTELLPGYAGAPHHLSSTSTAGDNWVADRSTEDTELSRLQTDYLNAIRRRNAAENAAILARKNGELTFKHDRCLFENDAIITMVQGRAPFSQAQSFRDALFQIVLVISETDTLLSSSRIDPDQQLNKEHLYSPENTALKMEKMLRSIGRFLERMAGTKVRDMVDNYHGTLDELEATVGDLEVEVQQRVAA